MLEAYFFSTWNIRAESGPTDGSTFENSLSIQRCPSNAGENCPAMNVFAIGVEEPHFTLSTMPCDSAAFMNAGAVAGVKSSRMPSLSRVNRYFGIGCDVVSVN